MVTAELAVALPAVALVLVLGSSAVATVADQVRCVDAARAVVRSAARGDARDEALAIGRRLAPAGAVLEVRTGPSLVEASVRSRPPAPLRWLGSRASPHADAVAAREEVP
jgi:hypothetical protein